jgi:ketosteroid isomerase-like protein
MKNAIALAFLLSVTAPAVAQVDGDRQAEEEMRRLNSQEVEALLRNDVATLRRLWSDDFVVTNPFNKFIKKQQVVGMTESGNLAFASYDRELEYIHIYQGVAVLAGSETVVWAGKMQNAGQTSRLRFTAIWMKQSAGWQEIARHANIIVQQ